MAGDNDGGPSAAFRFIDDDAVKPARIEHGCEELWFGDRAGPQYNFLVYFFEDARARIRARAYLDEIDKVTIFPATLKNSDGGPQAEIEAPELWAGALAYLRRRYLHVTPYDPRHQKSSKLSVGARPKRS
jgi:hypothetical protein